MWEYGMDNYRIEGIDDKAMEIEQGKAPDAIKLLSILETDITKCIEGRRAYKMAKRLFDVFFSAAVLIILMPFLLLLALVIFIDDPHGSPFYISERCGKYGRTFKFIKFRSMRMDAENQLDELLYANEMDGPVFKIKGDPRITRVGRFIRKCSIDELPQLVNVIKGDMSLVGPRPPIPREVEHYNLHQKQRLTVKPGLTCYWQVQPSRNSISFDDWVELDLKYITERSMRVDIGLIFKTIGVMVKFEGE